MERIIPSYLPDIQHAVQVETVRFGGECSEAEIQRLAQLMKDTGCDLVTGVGGGKTLDTAKAVAYQMKAPVVVVPTIASTDAPCSALSVIYKPYGTFDHYLILPQNPIWCWWILVLWYRPLPDSWWQVWVMLWLPGLKQNLQELSMLRI